MNEIEQGYGKLKEGMHVTGYTFERSCTTLTWLLQQNRWRQCGKGFKDINEFIDSIRMEDFKLAAEQRKKIATMIKALQPKVSNRKIAKAIGTSHQTIGRDCGGPSGPKRGKNSSKSNNGGGPSGPISGGQAASVVARHERVKETQGNVADRVAKVALDAKKLGKFSLILADPPWDDEFGACRRSIENHYPTMEFADILELPVDEVAHDQAMLFLWATPSMIEMALTTTKAWGFEYRTQMVWVKPSIGIGKYARQRHELLLICRRGEHPAPAPEDLPDSVVEAPRGEHSEKPEVFHKIIERMYPGAEKIELFRRGRPRKGWTAWGAETLAEAAE